MSTWIATIPTTQNPRIKKTLPLNNCWRSKSYHDACTDRDYLSTNTQETGNTGCLWLGENVLGNRSRREKLVTASAFQRFKFCTMSMCWPVLNKVILSVLGIFDRVKHITRKVFEILLDFSQIFLKVSDTENAIKKQDHKQFLPSL